MKESCWEQRLLRRHFIGLYLHNIIVFSFHHFIWLKPVQFGMARAEWENLPKWKWGDRGKPQTLNWSDWSDVDLNCFEKFEFPCYFLVWTCHNLCLEKKIARIVSNGISKFFSGSRKQPFQFSSRCVRYTLTVYVCTRAEWPWSAAVEGKARKEFKSTDSWSNKFPPSFSELGVQ